jgi:RNA-binding protein
VILFRRYNEQMPISLTAKDRARLKAKAHALEPNVSVGHAGATKAVIAEVERALAKHELIKVKVQIDDRDERKQIGEDLAAGADAAVVHRVGKIVILFRPKPKESEPE